MYRTSGLVFLNNLRISFASSSWENCSFGEVGLEAGWGEEEAGCDTQLGVVANHASLWCPKGDFYPQSVDVGIRFDPQCSNGCVLLRLSGASELESLGTRVAGCCAT